MECKNILISVIIPIYNTKDYLDRCLYSVINQTYDNLEIILVDDGSDDGSADICDLYEQMDKRIKVIHKQNGGLVSARKEGLKHATGEYVSYIDSDDWIECHAYEELSLYAKRYNPDFIESFFIKDYNGVTSVRKVSLEEGYYTKDKLVKSIEVLLNVDPPFLYAIHSSLCSKLIKRTFLNQYQNKVNNDLLLGEDFAVSFQLLINAESLYIVTHSYYHYCARGCSMTYDNKSSKYEMYLQLNEFIIGCLGGREGIFHRYFIQRTFDLLLDYLASVPDEYIQQFHYFPFYEDIKRDDRVIIYGKGLYAQNIIKVIKKSGFMSVVENIDSVDASDRLANIKESEYEYIMIAIGDHKIACAIRDYLLNLGIDYNKIRTISNKFISEENLPDEIKQMYCNRDKGQNQDE